MVHTLPPLAHAYNAFEPIIDARTMEIHHAKHHQAYVDNLNKSLMGTPYEHLSLEALFQMAEELPPAIRNNGGGHYNHSLFWTLLAPPTVQELTVEALPNVENISFAGAFLPTTAEKQPSGELAMEIDQVFGSFANFKIKFAEAAATRFGSGWAWLIWSAKEQKIIITSTPNQDNPLMALPGSIQGQPILGLDVWEHAYYLKYQNRRPDYIAAFWKVMNWEVANERYLQVK